MTGVLAAAQERVLIRLTGAFPALDQIQAASIAEAAQVRGKAWTALDRYLEEQPEAWSRPGTQFPPVFARLAHALVAAGHTGVTLPVCSRCGKAPVCLDRNLPEGRGCSTCGAQDRRGVCARCHRVMRIYTSGPDGPLCGTCTGRAKAVECGDCGRVRPAAARLADGSVRCQRCTPRPLRRCVSCGEDRPVQALTASGPVCRRCYQPPPRPCGRCGRVRPIERRARDDSPDLCSGCYHGPTATCSVCGRTRPCRHVGTGKPICQTCTPRPLRACARCTRHRPVQALWPMGPVCSNCYEIIRRAPAPCSDCGEHRPLVGKNPAGEPICGPCAGTDHIYQCRRCGTSGDLIQDQCCARCVLTERLTDLLTGDDGTMPDELHRVHRALTQAGRPRQVLQWLRRSRVPQLLAELAVSDESITHQRLDALPDTAASRYARDLLVAAGVLPTRDEALERLPRWADDLLAELPLQQRNIAVPFAHWHLLRRLRESNSRARAGRDTRRHLHIRSSLRRAVELLAWLDQHDIALRELTQAHLDRWLDEGATTRRHIAAFIAWARGRGLIGALIVPQRGRVDPATFIDDDERIHQLRRCLDEEDLPLWLRVAGSLILLFGLQGTTVLQLTRDDVHDDGTSVRITIRGHQLQLPPTLGHLVRQLHERGDHRGMLHDLGDTRTPWLFPGKSPSRPLLLNQLSVQLHQHGFSGLGARNTARLALAADLPASILADLTGTSVSSALHWTALAQRDWSDYIASRQQDPVS